MHVHGDNLKQKEQHKTKYRDKKSREYLIQIRKRYDAWLNDNLKLQGPLKKAHHKDRAICDRRVELLNTYKDYVDQQHFAEQFDARSNLHSSILEEFIYLLFRDLVADISSDALIGKSHTFKDLFVRATGYSELLSAPKIHVEKKDHDFAIGVKFQASFNTLNSKTKQFENWDVPALAVECKTYLDKTMLESASLAAEQLKLRNPDARYIVVAEWLKLTESVNLRKYKIDQIYILRKQKNTDREFRFDTSYSKNPIYADVVYQLFQDTRDFLTSPWEGSIQNGLSKGLLI